MPPDKRSRLVSIYRSNEKGDVVPAPGFGGDYSQQPTMPSGGGGLVSTAEDYYRFARMLANEGELDGVRILSPASVHLMSSNHLSPNLLTGQFRIGVQIMRPGLGYGYDCAVEFDPAQQISRRAAAQYPGMAPPVRGSRLIHPMFVSVAMIQRVLGPDSPPVNSKARPVVYQALLDPENKRIASNVSIDGLAGCYF